ncbi:MAG: hypothetical protein JXR95_11310 [Deltaproteobacteria bacterium]|nr:hypothetical protein [Deltaproteobacteria bacterium]
MTYLLLVFLQFFSIPNLKLVKLFSKGNVSIVTQKNEVAVKLSDGATSKFLLNSNTVVYVKGDASFSVKDNNTILIKTGYFNIYTISQRKVTAVFHDVSYLISDKASFKASTLGMCILKGTLVSGKSSFSPPYCIGRKNIGQFSGIWKMISFLPSLFTGSLNKGFSMKSLNVVSLFSSSAGDSVSGGGSSGMCLNDSSSSSAGGVGIDNQTITNPLPQSRVRIIISPPEGK